VYFLLLLLLLLPLSKIKQNAQQTFKNTKILRHFLY